VLRRRGKSRGISNGRWKGLFLSGRHRSDICERGKGGCQQDCLGEWCHTGRQGMVELAKPEFTPELKFRGSEFEKSSIKVRSK
jgi:hypothetical protein